LIEISKTFVVCDTVNAMRTELMNNAICWDLSDNVTAEYAYANDDYSFFCPHKICLQEVRPKQIKNAHFLAPGKHISGCPNEPEQVEGKDTATTPAKKKTILPTPAIPTELGPAKKRKGKKRKPTRDELLALADSLKAKPPCCAGTLPEVVDAWLRIRVGDRSNRRLLINNQELNYETAFYCLSRFGDSPIEDLHCNTKIIHGAALVDVKDDCYWIKSIKRIKTGENKLSLIIRIPRDNGAAAQYIDDLLATSSCAKSFSLFYFGALPEMSPSGKSYLISNDISDSYQRFVVRATS
jgi:hypothetical protein